MAKQVVSKKWTLNTVEIKAVLRNALIFLAPVLVISLEIIQRNGTLEEVLVAVKVWVLGVLLDVFRKAQAGK